jgi:type III secretion protein J
MTKRPQWLLLLSFAACRSQIQHGLDERDANEIVSVLVARGFDARKDAEKGKKPTWAVEVDDDRATDALRVLTELKLPRPPRTTTREVAAQTGFIDTPGAERLRQLEALEGDVEQTLETMDGVVSAGVEIVVPAPARPGQVPLPSKASALLRVQAGSYERIQQQRTQLRELIAGSVEGLKPDDVALVVDPVESHVAMPAPDAAAAKLKVMVLVLSVLLTAVAGVLAVMSIQLRRVTKRRSVTRPEPKPAPVPKPVIAAAAQRKVA